MQPKEKKLDIIFAAFINTKDCPLNASLSLNDYGFDEENDLLRVASLHNFEKHALTQEARMLSLEATHSGSVVFHKSKKKTINCDAIVVQHHLYLFKAGEQNPQKVIPLDYCYFHKELAPAGSDAEDMFKLERIGFDVFSSKPVLLSVSGGTNQIEWSTLFRSTCRNTISQVVFGTPLQILMRRTQESIPAILAEGVRYLKGFMNEEGIFRKSCNGQELQKWIEKWDSGEAVKYPAGTDPHVVVGTIKRWLSQLPSPILSPFDHFFAAFKPEQPLETSKKAVMELVGQLPHLECCTLSFLCDFFYELAKHADKTLMTIENFSLIIGPNLMRSKTVTTVKELQAKTATTNSIVELLIRNHEEVAAFAQEANRKVQAKNQAVAEQQKDPLSRVQDVIRASEFKSPPKSPISKKLSSLDVSNLEPAPQQEVTTPTRRLGVNAAERAQLSRVMQKRRRSCSVGEATGIVHEMQNNSNQPSNLLRQESMPVLPKYASKSSLKAPSASPGTSPKTPMLLAACASEGEMTTSRDEKSERSEREKSPRPSPRAERTTPLKLKTSGLDSSSPKAEGRPAVTPRKKREHATVHREGDSDVEMVLLLKSIQDQLQAEIVARKALEQRLEHEIKERKKLESLVLEKLGSQAGSKSDSK